MCENKYKLFLINMLGAAGIDLVCGLFIPAGTSARAATDYYEVLEVSRDASAEDIKKSYRKLAKKYHPDGNEGRDSAKKKFQELNRAYETLKDAERRAEYDRDSSDILASTEVPVRRGDWPIDITPPSGRTMEEMWKHQPPFSFVGLASVPEKLRKYMYEYQAVNNIYPGLSILLLELDFRPPTEEQLSIFEELNLYTRSDVYIEPPAYKSVYRPRHHYSAMFFFIIVDLAFYLEENHNPRGDHWATKYSGSMNRRVVDNALIVLEAIATREAVEYLNMLAHRWSHLNSNSPLRDVSEKAKKAAAEIIAKNATLASRLKPQRKVRKTKNAHCEETLVSRV